MDEGAGEHGLIYLSSHEIRSLQYVVKADGCAVSLPGHEVLRQQESPSLDGSERSYGNTPLQSSCKRFNQIQLTTDFDIMSRPWDVCCVAAYSLFVRLSTGYSLTLPYAIIHAFIQSPKGTAGSL
jgi:hypothetical protein